MQVVLKFFIKADKMALFLILIPSKMVGDHEVDTLLFRIGA